MSDNDPTNGASRAEHESGRTYGVKELYKVRFRGLRVGVISTVGFVFFGATLSLFRRRSNGPYSI